MQVDEQRCGLNRILPRLDFPPRARQFLGCNFVPQRLDDIIEGSWADTELLGGLLALAVVFNLALPREGIE